MEGLQDFIDMEECFWKVWRCDSLAKMPD